MLSVIATEGYNEKDLMYYVKQEGVGMAGMEQIKGSDDVEEMLHLYQQKRCVTITVMEGGPGKRTDFQMNIVDELDKQIPIAQVGSPKVYDIDESGVLYPSQTRDDSAGDYLFTQESSNLRKGKIVAEINAMDEFLNEFADEMQIIQVEKNKGEEELQECENMNEEDDVDVEQKIKDLKRKRVFEGDSEPEDLFCEQEEEEEECHFQPPPLQKIPVRRGPTTRAHCSSEVVLDSDFTPFSDEDVDDEDVWDSEEEFVNTCHSSGRKSRAKKRKPRKWYDENRLMPQEQICWQMCFTDVYQFRRALVNLHVSQRRNFHHHRNNKDRIIVDCLEKDCKFHMVASVIANEKTFVIRKLQIEHTCAPSGENCKVPARFVAQAVEDSFRTDPKAGIDTVIDKTKENYGVEVGKVKAYRARQHALNVVQGDQEAQYTRIRDYLQAVLDTNPGSRCIVTTRVVAEHPSPNPRFHRLFMCLAAQTEGFLNGCRPFIGILE